MTNSRLRVARACLRKHHIQFELGYRPKKVEGPLLFGGVWHKGMEAWWLAAKAGQDRLPAALKAIDAHSEGLDGYDIWRMRVMLTAYTEAWRIQWDKLGIEHVIGVEVPFECPLVNPETGRPSQTWRLAGKIDVIVRAKGRVYIIEHKSSGEDISPGSVYWQKLRLDSQVSTYLMGAQSLGYDVAGCIYDVAGKPRLRPLREGKPDQETPEAYGQRCAEAIMKEPARYSQIGEVVRLESEVEEFRAELWDYATLLREAHNEQHAPRNTDSCFSYNRPCGYWPVCSGAASLEDVTLYVQNDDKHPELSEDSAA